MIAWRHYLELIAFKAYAELKTDATKTYIGVLWWIFDPILYMAIFYVVFGLLLERGGEHFIQFLLVGLVFFRWFGNSVSSAAQSILLGKGLMQQVYLPKIVFPLVSFVSDTFKFMFTLLLLLAFLWLSGFPPTAVYLALPVLMAVQLLLTLGALLLTAATLPVVPDLRFLVTHGVHIMLYLSGIFYSGADLRPDQQKFFYMNPTAYLIEAYREVLMYGRWPEFERLWLAVLTGATLLLIALWILHRLDRRYPKIVRAH